MHIIIIGGGIAGLGAYLHLRKYLPNADSHTIRVFERHDPAKSSTASQTAQGGLGIAPNGMRVLRRLDEGIHKEVQATGYPTKACSFRTAGGWSIATWSAWTEAPTREGMLMIGRDRLWEILRRRVPDGDIRYGAVEEVRIDGTVVLVGGETTNADLVIGADGIWSKTRRAVIDDCEVGREPIRQNPMTVGGTMPTSYLENLGRRNEPAVVMTFGATGFVGYGPASSTTHHDGRDQDTENAVPGPHAMWWATYKESSTPTHDTSSPNETPTQAQAQAAFIQRHADWTDPTIRRIISDFSPTPNSPFNPSLATPESTSPQATIKPPRPTYTVPALPRWHRGRLVLLADAAHSLPVTTGQGVSQALEDTAALALLLARSAASGAAGSGGPDGCVREQELVEALDRFQALRKPRVERLAREAAGMGGVGGEERAGWVEQLVVYAVMFVTLRLLGRRRDAWKLEYGVEEEVGWELD